ncbi:MAG: hypothetical protein K2K35_10670 [Lachnospiraceae bacterium]|nr:hypothetical protein [Lachnospiraceae bacterium]
MVWIKFTEIKKAVNSLLHEKYPAYKIYGLEVKEGYETPSFFTEIIDKGSSMETKNFASGGFTVKITYFQKEKNEADQLEKADEIKELFGLVFQVGKRRLTTGEYSHSFVGEYSDILQINIDFDYKENIQKEDTAPLAGTLYLKTGQGGIR